MINKEKIILSGKFAFYVGGIQTISTYASAEVTSAVVKVIQKIPEYQFSPTKYFILFFCRSKKLKRLRPRYPVVILQNLSNAFAYLPCRKNCFSRKYPKTHQYSRKSLKIPLLYHMFIFQMPAEFNKMHRLNRLQIMLYGNCFNSLSLKYFDHF